MSWAYLTPDPAILSIRLAKKNLRDLGNYLPRG